jgi:hypothetical protein
MDIKCSNCNASLFKSYGNTYKLRSRSIRWDGLDNTATVQCNLCRSFNDMPLELKVDDAKIVIKVSNRIKKGSLKEKLVIQKDKVQKSQQAANNSKNQQKTAK